jgi:nitroreductase
MHDIIETIRTRKSVRTYDGRSVPDDLKRDILASIPAKGPFGTSVRLVWVTETDPDRIRELGTYGMIQGASDFLAGLVRRDAGDRGFLDFGYCFETAILSATSLGLGTCWLGGTFNRGGFARKAGADSDEMVCAASPVGWPAIHRSFIESASRFVVAADRRRPFSDLFFEEDGITPLQADPVTANILECVRLAPSATNKQPWRIVRSGGEFRFYCAQDSVYKRVFSFIQTVDLGIAMRHFEAAAGMSSWKGGWKEGRPEMISGQEWIPVAIWRRD